MYSTVVFTCSSLPVDEEGLEEPGKVANLDHRRRVFISNFDIASTSTTKRGGGGGGGGGGGVGGQSSAPTNLITKKELLKHKDIKVRKWEFKPLVFYALNGSEIQIPSWQSGKRNSHSTLYPQNTYPIIDQRMTVNQKATEPITVTEIDQLFSSTSGEKDFRPFLCTQPGCSKSFTTFDQLQTHETNMHGTKKLVCGIDGCHKSFVTPGQLTKHRKMVHFRAARKAKMVAAAAAAAEAEAEAEAASEQSKKD